MGIHRISIDRDGDPSYGEFRVVLEADGPGSSYEQAVNLLRLCLPQCRQ